MELDFLQDIEIERALKVYNYQDELGDSPAEHRWRAQWDNDYDGTVKGIALMAYPVVSVTRCGAWIAPDSWRETTREGRGWHIGSTKRWVSNDGGAAWAKPTQEDALHSIAVRLDRWALRLRNDVQKLRQAAQVILTLRPDDSHFARRALETISIEGGK